jgi:hypothetical protein
MTFRSARGDTEVNERELRIGMEGIIKFFLVSCKERENRKEKEKRKK